MLTVTFAFVLATALFFLFRQTRWMGVVGVFVLVCLAPLVFTSLLLLAGAIYYWVAVRRRARTFLGPPRAPADDADKNQRNLVVLLGTLGIGGALALGYSGPRSGSSPARVLDAVRSPASDEVIVLRTPGGLLEVSRIHATELLDARVPHTVFGLEIGELVPRIRVPAVYRYQVELAPEWRVVRKDGVFTVVVPAVQASLPVAVDFDGLEKDVAGSWILLPWKGTEDLENLERTITTKLAQKASSADYVERQRQDARETVREFARKWLVEQTRWDGATFDEVQVFFADESAGSMDWPAG